MKLFGKRQEPQPKDEGVSAGPLPLPISLCPHSVDISHLPEDEKIIINAAWKSQATDFQNSYKRFDR